MVLNLRYTKKVREPIATIQCPNNECGAFIWLTGVRFFYQHCPECGTCIREAYILDEGYCIDRLRYYNADNLA